MRRTATISKTSGCSSTRMNATAERKVRRTAQYEVEPFVIGDRAAVAKVSVPDIAASFEPVVTGGSSGERDAHLLRFDRHQTCARQPPGSDGRDAANAAAEIQNRGRRRTPARAIPSRQQIVCGESMAVAKLKEPEMSRYVVERFLRRKLRNSGGTRRDWAGAHPAAETIRHVRSNRHCDTNS